MFVTSGICANNIRGKTYLFISLLFLFHQADITFKETPEKNAICLFSVGFAPITTSRSLKNMKALRMILIYEWV